MPPVSSEAAFFWLEAAIYKRLGEQGRMMQEKMKYAGSWIEPGFERCFQVMKYDDQNLFHEWTKQWEDLMEFEIIPVITSQEAVASFDHSE